MPDAEPGTSAGVKANFTLAQNSAQHAEEPKDQQDDENSPEHAAEAPSDRSCHMHNIRPRRRTITII
jgi:hypothetical protein